MYEQTSSTDEYCWQLAATAESAADASQLVKQCWQRMTLTCTALAAARCTTAAADDVQQWVRTSDFMRCPCDVCRCSDQQHLSACCSMTTISYTATAAITTALCLQANCCVSLGSNDKWQGCETSSNLYTCVSQFDDKPLAVCCS
jgi:hypothetical protein